MFREFVGSVKKSLGFDVEEKAYSLSDPETPELFGALPTASGVTVNAKSALRVPTVLQAVRLIAEAVGSLPCKLYRDADGSKEGAKDHAGYRLAHKLGNHGHGEGEGLFAVTEIGDVLHAGRLAVKVMGVVRAASP